MTEPISTAFAPLEWRDSIIRAMLRRSSPGHASAAILREADHEMATVVLTALRRFVVLLAWPQDDALGHVRLGQRLDRVQEELRAGIVVDVLIVGGGAAGEKLCRERGAVRFRLGTIRFHHLNADGALQSVSGAPSPPVEEALEDVRASLARGEALSILSRGEQVVAREAFKRTARAEEAAFELLSNRNVPATTALLVVLAGIFVLELWWSRWVERPWFAPAGLTLFRMGASNLAALREGEWWRLCTPAFLHGNLVHIFVNGWSLWVLGGPLERLLGSARFLVIYGVSAFVAAVASTVFGDAMSVGASGAIFGLMGAAMAIGIRPQGVLPADLAWRLRQALWTQLPLNIVISTIPGIDWHAHLGGAIAGFALMLTGIPAWRLPPIEVRAASGTRSPLWSGVSLAIILGMAAALGAALGRGRPWDSGPGDFGRVTLKGTGLSMEVPKSLSESGSSVSEASAEFLFGQANRTAVFFQLLVEPARELAGAPPEEIEAFLLDSTESGEQGGTKLGEPKLVTTAAGPVLSQQGTINGWNLSIRGAVRGDRLVILRLFSGPDMPPDWSGLEMKLIGSVRPE